MGAEIYFQPRTRLQALYYDLRAEAAPDLRLVPLLHDEDLDYLGRYLLLRELHRSLQPFQFVRVGDVVVHVGFDRVYFGRGMSHPLIYASLVGDAGHVLAVDPDPRNADALRRYIGASGIRNMTVAEGAAWEKETSLEFLFDDDWSPLSVPCSLAEIADHPGPGRRAATRATVKAQTLDEIVRVHMPDRPVTLVSLTANGSEPQILRGSKALLSSDDLRISMALSFRHFSYVIRKRLCQDLAAAGHLIAVSDAPHDPWSREPFFWAMALKKSPHELVEMGFLESTWASLEEGAEEREALLRTQREEPQAARPGRRSLAALRRWLSSR